MSCKYKKLNLRPTQSIDSFLKPTKIKLKKRKENYK